MNSEPVDTLSPRTKDLKRTLKANGLMMAVRIPVDRTTPADDTSLVPRDRTVVEEDIIAAESCRGLLAGKESRGELCGSFWDFLGGLAPAIALSNSLVCAGTTRLTILTSSSRLYS